MFPQTVTAGDLALAAGDIKLELMAQVAISCISISSMFIRSWQNSSSSPRSVIIDELVRGNNLLVVLLIRF
jgi:hypothetical protein